MALRRYLAILAVLAVGPAHADESSAWQSYRVHDFFALQKQLPPPSPTESPRTAFLRAAGLAAFGRPAESARILVRVSQTPLTDRALAIDMRELLMLDRRAVFQYAAARQAIAPLLTGDPLRDDARLADLRNRARLLDALSGAAVQTVRHGSGAPFAVSAADGAVEVSVEGRQLHLTLDSGASFSALSRSAARMLGLRVRQARFSVGSATGARVETGVTTADLVFPDGTVVRNAVFLVLPDDAAGPQTGLVGLPVLAGLGTMIFNRSTLVFGKDAPPGRTVALAMAGNDPLLRVVFRGSELLCRLDTGTAHSIFYAPFAHRFPDSLTGAPKRMGWIRGTAGGGLDAFQTRALTLTLAGESLTVYGAAVVPKPVPDADPNLDCSIGRDVLHGFAGYALDLKRMKLVLMSP